MTRFAEITIMGYNIIISTEAAKDISDAYTFYEDQQTGLGDRFLSELTHFFEN